ncbi:MAG: glycoside hydrolase family 88 protein, partial [Oscillospiraceae bacterium]
MNIEKAKVALSDAIKILDAHLDDFKGGFPAAASVHNVYPNTENTDWTNGFYTGMLWMAYEFTNDEKYRKIAEEHIVSFRDRIEKKIVVNHHDMGFLYHLSCVKGYEITGSEYAKETALLAADNLKLRFREKGQFIQAWGELDAEDNYRLIIDCLLNLPLLFWASEVTGDESYRKVAEAHLKTT